MSIPIGINSDTVRGMRELEKRLSTSEENMKAAMDRLKKALDEHNNKLGIYQKGIQAYAEDLESVESEFLKQSEKVKDITLFWSRRIEDEINEETGGGSGQKKALGSTPKRNDNVEQPGGKSI